jgi:chorismate synthase
MHNSAHATALNMCMQYHYLTRTDVHQADTMLYSIYTAFVCMHTGRTRTSTNRSGGIQGGISNGETIIIRVAFKPTSTIGQEQNTVRYTYIYTIDTVISP